MSHRTDAFGENFRAQWSTWQTRRQLTRALLPPPSPLSWAQEGPVTHTHTFKCDRRIHLILNIPQPVLLGEWNNGNHPSMMLWIVRKELVNVRYMLHQDLDLSLCQLSSLSGRLSIARTLSAKERSIERQSPMRADTWTASYCHEEGSLPDSAEQV